MHDEQLHYYAGMEDRHWWFTARRSIITDLVRRVLPPKIGKRIVDIGCGVGTLIGALADEYACTGFDTSDTAIRLAAERFPGAHFVYAPSSPPDDPAVRSADLILLTDVIEHVEDDKGFLTTLTTMMKPGAELLITVPAHMSLWTKHDETVLHFRRYEKEALKALIAPVGFHTRLFSFFNTRLHPVIRVVRALNRITGRTSGGSDTDFAMPPMFLNRVLEKIFAGECKKLLASVDTGKPGYTDGVSLITILQKPL